LKSKDLDWARELFVTHARLFYPVLEDLKASADEDVCGIVKIFERFKVKRGSRVLDLFCGIGRHSVKLAKMGYEIVGYDPSLYFLRKAGEWAKQEKQNSPKIRFYHGAPGFASETLLRNGEKPFDAIIIMFTSIGYSNILNDVLVFNDPQLLAKKECILLLETENRDWRIRNFQPFIEYRYKRLLIHESWDLNMENSVFKGSSNFYRIFDKDQVLRRLLALNIKLRLYSLHELINILSASGWKFLISYSNLYSDFPATLDSQNMITVYKKW
jgi:SAM-dependent methyltransferase